MSFTSISTSQTLESSTFAKQCRRMREWLRSSTVSPQVVKLYCIKVDNTSSLVEFCRRLSFVAAKALSGRPLVTVGVSRHHELLYNLGIQLLHAGQCLAAFDCLVEVVTMYRINPQLWLRLAECIIMAHKAVSLHFTVPQTHKKQSNRVNVAPTEQ